MIDPNKIITEGKYDEDLHEDPVMVMVDDYIDSLQEAEEELFLGHTDDMSLVDIVAGNDSDFSQLDKEEEELKYLASTDTPLSQR